MGRGGTLVCGNANFLTAYIRADTVMFPARKGAWMFLVGNKQNTLVKSIPGPTMGNPSESIYVLFYFFLSFFLSFLILPFLNLGSGSLFTSVFISQAEYEILPERGARKVGSKPRRGYLDPILLECRAVPRPHTELVICIKHKYHTNV